MYAYDRKPPQKMRHTSMPTQSGVGQVSAMQQMVAHMGNQARLAYFEQSKQLPTRTESGGEPISDALRKKFERKSGVPLNDVQVHRNSDKPAELGAEAYAQSNQIFIGPGNEKDLEHEIGHVVQQKQGLVKPTDQVNAVSINRDARLEHAPVKKMGISHAHKTSRPQVIQCCSYDKDCPYSDPCPVHSEFYSQEKDPTLRHFLRKGESFIGQQAFRSQEEGKPVQADQIRVRAHLGAGLHEMVPTDMRNKLPNIEGIAGLQSGARTDAGDTVFVVNGKIAGHTGTFRNMDGKNTLLTGQAAAHDMVRKSIQGNKEMKLPCKGISATKKRNAIIAGAIKTLATGHDIVESKLLNSVQLKRTNAPLGLPYSQDRVPYAQKKHESREHAKQRLFNLNTFYGLLRPVSPERFPIDENGNGGMYLPEGTSLRPLSPLPKFVGNNPTEKAANEAAWTTAPLRRGFSSPNMKICPHCGTPNELKENLCWNCHKRIEIEQEEDGALSDIKKDHFSSDDETQAKKIKPPKKHSLFSDSDKEELEEPYASDSSDSYDYFEHVLDLLSFPDSDSSDSDRSDSDRSDSDRSDSDRSDSDIDWSFCTYALHKDLEKRRKHRY